MHGTLQLTAPSGSAHGYMVIFKKHGEVAAADDDFSCQSSPGAL